jgi:DNA-directed RNA polymerase specialized sigma24 family protein
MSFPTDDDDFAAFYRVEAEFLVRFLLGVGASVPDAVDAAGRAFTEVHARWEQLTDPRTYLRRIAINELDALPTDPYPGGPSAFRGSWATEFIEHACQQEDIRRLLTALRALPRREREILAWHRDGYTAGDTAEVLGINLSTVQAGLRAAIDALRQRGIGDLDWS